MDANCNQKTKENINLRINNETRNQSEGGWVEKTNKHEEIKNYHHMIVRLIFGKDLMEQLKNYRK